MYLRMFNPLACVFFIALSTTILILLILAVSLLISAYIFSRLDFFSCWQPLDPWGLGFSSLTCWFICFHLVSFRRLLLFFNDIFFFFFLYHFFSDSRFFAPWFRRHYLYLLFRLARRPILCRFFSAIWPCLGGPKLSSQVNDLRSLSLI